MDADLWETVAIYKADILKYSRTGNGFKLKKYFLISWTLEYFN